MLIVTALLALASSTAPLRDHDLFAPEKGLALERTSHSSFEFELDDWSAEMNGQPIPAEYLPELDIKGHDEFVVQTTDTYLACADGKPLSIRRRFDDLSAKRSHSVSVNDESKGASERIGTCALKGCVVLLDDRATGGERRKLEQGHCDQALVDALALDFDLTAFLPPDAKATTWEVPASALNLFDEHIGGLAFTYDKPEEQRHSDPEQLARNAAGKWTVERGEPRDEAGVRVLPLKISAKETAHSEIEGELKNVPVASGPTIERAEMTLDVHGELLWDLQRHVLHSLSLEGASSMTYATRTKQETEPGTPTYSQEMSFRGYLKLATETKLAP